MKIIQTKDYAELSRRAAELIAAQVREKPDCVLGLATGSSPVGTYEELRRLCCEEGLDFSRVRSVNLDEYVGLGGTDDQSYRYFMDSNLFDHVNIDKANTHVPNGRNPDAEAECAAYDAMIEALGGIDLQLLGLGPNGHIGFNEPDEVFTLPTHRVALTESTIRANKRFFEREEDVPRFAYTMGIGAIMRARRVVMVVNGPKKAEAVRRAFFGPVTPQVPASILQLHPDFTLVADEAALGL